MEPNKPHLAVVGAELVYREFMRLKYNTFHARYPHWDESTVTNYVLKMWNKMSDDDKVALKEKYISKNYLDSTYDPKTKQEIITKKPADWRKNAPPDLRPDKMKILESDPVADQMMVYQDYYPGQQPAQKPKSDSKEKKKRNPSRRQHSFSRSSSSDEQSSNNQPQEGYPKLTEVYRQKMEAKKLRKQQKQKKQKVRAVRQNMKDKQYYQFYRKKYDQIAQQHRNWRPHQINTIVKLLWRKEKLQKERGSLLTKNKLKPGKALRKRIRKHPITPYGMFKKNYIVKHGRQTTGKQVQEAYKHTTFELKHLMKKQAEAYNKEHVMIPEPPKQKPKKKEGQEVQQQPVQQPEIHQAPHRISNSIKPMNLFSFMNKVIDPKKE